jgi:hypothetical protein
VKGWRQPGEAPRQDETGGDLGRRPERGGLAFQRLDRSGLVGGGAVVDVVDRQQERSAAFQARIELLLQERAEAGGGLGALTLRELRCMDVEAREA